MSSSVNETHLRRILRAYLAYYHRSRTHLGLNKDAPDCRPTCVGVWGRVYLREAPDAVVAPIGGLVRDHGQWAVFCVDQGRAHLQRIRIGTLTDAEAEVLSGVGPGDRLVVYPSDEVHEGVTVREK
jgi:hypothetical protein